MNAATVTMTAGEAFILVGIMGTVVAVIIGTLIGFARGN